MNYMHIIQHSIDYIEENLKAEISAEELAGAAGFSLFHYYRIFQQFTGMPVMQFIIRRKLLNAIYEVQCGRKMLEAALDYGFETHAGFYKAFQREYDCSPTEYLRIAPARQPHKIILRQEEKIMLTHSKLKEIAKNWNLEEPITIKDIYFGGNRIKSEDTSYVNEKYIIKFGNSLARLRQHFALSKAICDAGLEAAVPIPTRNGMDYAADGENYFFLYHVQDGEILESCDCLTGDYKAKARYLGECIAQLHKILLKYDKNLPINEANLYKDATGWAMPVTKQQMELHKYPLPDRFYTDYSNIFGKMAENLPRQLIHRNICPSNFRVKEGKLTGFADFELSERNIRLFDPCYCATGILSECMNGNDPSRLDKWPEILVNIITGYDSVCKLTQEERQAVIYVVYSIQMICIAYFGGIERYTELTDINCRMLSWIYEYTSKNADWYK